MTQSEADVRRSKLCPRFFCDVSLRCDSTGVPYTPFPLLSSPDILPRNNVKSKSSYEVGDCPLNYKITEYFRIYIRVS